MGAKFLGVPFLVWGGLCLALALVWVVVWPSDRSTQVTGLRLFILRWFHALTWLLLALAAFLTGLNILGGASTARLVALLGLAAYLCFVAAFVTSASGR